MGERFRFSYAERMRELEERRHGEPRPQTREHRSRSDTHFAIVKTVIRFLLDDVRLVAVDTLQELAVHISLWSALCEGANRPLHEIVDAIRSRDDVATLDRDDPISENQLAGIRMLEKQLNASPVILKPTRSVRSVLLELQTFETFDTAGAGDPDDLIVMIDRQKAAMATDVEELLRAATVPQEMRDPDLRVVTIGTLHAYWKWCELRSNRLNALDENHERTCGVIRKQVEVFVRDATRMVATTKLMRDRSLHGLDWYRDLRDAISRLYHAFGALPLGENVTIPEPSQTRHTDPLDNALKDVIDRVSDANNKMTTQHVAWRAAFALDKTRAAGEIARACLEITGRKNTIYAAYDTLQAAHLAAIRNTSHDTGTHVLLEALRVTIDDTLTTSTQLFAAMEPDDVVRLLDQFLRKLAVLGERNMTLFRAVGTRYPLSRASIGFGTARAYVENTRLIVTAVVANQTPIPGYPIDRWVAPVATENDLTLFATSTLLGTITGISGLQGYGEIGTQARPGPIWHTYTAPISNLLQRTSVFVRTYYKDQGPCEILHRTENQLAGARVGQETVVAGAVTAIDNALAVIGTARNWLASLNQATGDVEIPACTLLRARLQLPDFVLSADSFAEIQTRTTYLERTLQSLSEQLRTTLTYHQTVYSEGAARLRAAIAVVSTAHAADCVAAHALEQCVTELVGCLQTFAEAARQCLAAKDCPTATAANAKRCEAETNVAASHAACSAAHNKAAETTAAVTSALLAFAAVSKPTTAVIPQALNDRDCAVAYALYEATRIDCKGQADTFAADRIIMNKALASYTTSVHQFQQHESTSAEQGTSCAQHVSSLEALLSSKREHDALVDVASTLYTAIASTVQRFHMTPVTTINALHNLLAFRKQPTVTQDFVVTATSQVQELIRQIRTELERAVKTKINALHVAFGASDERMGPEQQMDDNAVTMPQRVALGSEAEFCTYITSGLRLIIHTFVDSFEQVCPVMTCLLGWRDMIAGGEGLSAVRDGSILFGDDERRRQWEQQAEHFKTLDAVARHCVLKEDGDKILAWSHAVDRVCAPGWYKGTFTPAIQEVLGISAVEAQRVEFGEYMAIYRQRVSFTPSALDGVHTWVVGDGRALPTYLTRAYDAAPNAHRFLPLVVHTYAAVLALSLRKVTNSLVHVSEQVSGFVGFDHNTFGLQRTSEQVTECGAAANELLDRLLNLETEALTPNGGIVYTADHGHPTYKYDIMRTLSYYFAEDAVGTVLPGLVYEAASAAPRELQSLPPWVKFDVVLSSCGRCRESATKVAHVLGTLQGQTWVRSDFVMWACTMSKRLETFLMRAGAAITAAMTQMKDRNKRKHDILQFEISNKLSFAEAQPLFKAGDNAQVKAMAEKLRGYLTNPGSADAMEAELTVFHTALSGLI